jgi:restriction system protein
MKYLLFLLFGIIFLLFRSARFKGYIGERKVSSKIESLISRNNKYQSFHDMTLQTPDGTTQIDHILISPYGIFVIETKNLKGWIFGSRDQKIWTQTLYGKKYKFQNPLHQNYKHIKAVQNLLNADIKTIISIVVFVGDSEFKTEMPINVVELRDFLPYLSSYTQQILSGESIDKYSQILRNPAHNAPTNQRDHVRNVKQNKNNPICPRCGKPMVLRTARKGRKAGSKFWGCSGFPSCKATKNVA